MRAKTHLIFGILVYLLLAKFIGSGILLLCGILFFSILPDIDYYNSKIGKKSKPFSFFLNFIFGHRGILHTIYIPALLYFLIMPINKTIAIASALGYISHLFLDSLTLSGIRPFSPLYNKEIKGFVKTGGVFEAVIFFMLAATCIWMMV